MLFGPSPDACVFPPRAGGPYQVGAARFAFGRSHTVPSPKAKPTSPRRRHNRADVGLTGDDLTPRRALFVLEYLRDWRMNATQAARNAGFSEETAKKAGSQLLHDPWVAAEIKTAIAERKKRLQHDGDHVLSQLAAIANLDPRKVVSWNNTSITVNPSDSLSLDDARCITGIKPHFNPTNGEMAIELKFADKMRALDLLGRHYGLWGKIVLDDPSAVGGDPVEDMASDTDPDVRPE